MTDYNYDTLGWYQFERICQALLKSWLGLAVEAWGGSSDLGRDAYCDTPLRFPTEADLSPGPFVFQVKFVQGANAAGSNPRPRLLDAVRLELDRIQNRRNAGTWSEPRHYVLITNVVPDANLRTEIHDKCSEILHTSDVHILGGADLDAMLHNNPNVRLTFPQILGLRDLNELIASAVTRDVRERSTIELELSARLAQVFVPTAAYSEALSILNNHGFVVLMGPPEVGKTSIARMIALTRHTQGWDAFECHRPEDMLAVYDSERHQVFVADDAFGSTEYRSELANAWADDMHRVLSRADHHHWVIMTSRPGPLRQALRRLHFQGEAARFPEPGKVLVDARVLTRLERALMLYRHCKASGVRDSSADLIRAEARWVVGSDSFTPFRISRLVTDLIPSLESAVDDRNALGKAKEALRRAISEPTQPMSNSFQALDESHKYLLITMLDAEHDAYEVSQLEESFRRIFGDIELPIDQLVNDLDEHFVSVTEDDG